MKVIEAYSEVNHPFEVYHIIFFKLILNDSDSYWNRI